VAVKVGVFDSGIGGLSVVNAIMQAIPDLQVVFKNDAAHMPYGTKSIEEIYSLTTPVIQQLVDEGCQLIVIACNTVTTNLISRLRQEFNVPFVGMEPMVKPAAEASQTKIIAVCATPRTLASPRYQWLKQEFAVGVKVLEPDCSDWAYMIETNSVNQAHINQTVEQVIGAGADVIVLGCTHYHWIEMQIKQVVAGRATVLQPESPVINQLKTVLSQLA
jgi:glutamate racemase